MKENITDIMQKAYIDYSMSVIVSRALPDVRDGFKPVQRRVLYAMLREGLLHNRAYDKCAGVVGEVLKNYHPHGDSSVYDTLVRMAQPWVMRYPLVVLKLCLVFSILSFEVILDGVPNGESAQLSVTSTHSDLSSVSVLETVFVGQIFMNQ